MSEIKRLFIIGSGALGSTLAGVIAPLNRTEVYLVGQSPHARAIRENGLELEIVGGQTSRIGLNVLTPLEVPELGREDLVLLTGKAPALVDIGSWLGSKCSAETVIIALQNGIGISEFAAQALGRPVERGLIFFGINSPKPGRVRSWPGKPIRLRPFARADEFCRLMAGSAIGCEQARDFAAIKWLKLAINCVANPLAGLFGIDNSRIVAAGLDPAKEAILAEVRAVASAEGVKLETTAADINGYLKTKNTPSLRADIERGSRTEIDFLNGAVVRAGARHGIPTPVNETVVSLIKFLSGK